MTPIRPKSITCKHVRDLPIKATLKPDGVIVIAQKHFGIIFSFPAAVWPKGSYDQMTWVVRLTPFWDSTDPVYFAQCHRLREACQSAINTLLNSQTINSQTIH